MTATGAAQTPLEGNALASGCTGCDGKAIYATITKYIASGNWYDDAQGVIIEDLTGLTSPVVNKEVVAYAYFNDKAPKKLAKNEWTLSLAGEVSGFSVNDENKTISASSAGTAVVVATVTAKPALTTNKSVTVE